MEKLNRTDENKGSFPLNTQLDPELVEMQTKMEAGLESMGKTGYIVLQRYYKIGWNDEDYMHTRISGKINGHRVIADRSTPALDRIYSVDIWANKLLDCSEEEEEKARGCGTEIFLEIDGQNMSSNTEIARKFWDTYSEFAFDIDKAKKIEAQTEEERMQEKEEERGRKLSKEVLF